MNRFEATQEIIIAFINELNSILSSEKFNMNKDFILIPGKNNKNLNTLEDLEFTTTDVISELKALNITDYNHSVPDDKYPNMPDFHIFYKLIKNKEVYIKIRIQNNKIVFCISFHYPVYTSHKANPYI